MHGALRELHGPRRTNRAFFDKRQNAFFVGRVVYAPGQEKLRGVLGAVNDIAHARAEEAAFVGELVGQGVGVPQRERRAGGRAAPRGVGLKTAAVGFEGSPPGIWRCVSPS
ncbi:MAG: hypothetical protein M5R36_03880 [Deltaproteobacteria bacterium]|nr:hypothetical protein [Deltaproteobacteria bacterium]